MAAILIGQKKIGQEVMEQKMPGEDRMAAGTIAQQIGGRFSRRRQRAASGFSLIEVVICSVCSVWRWHQRRPPRMR